MFNFIHHKSNAEFFTCHITLAKIKKCDNVLSVKGKETDTLLYCGGKLEKSLWGEMWLYLLKFKHAETF